MQIGLIRPGAYVIPAALILSINLAGVTAATANGVYTIANYPVEATARNAVAAKKLALKLGRTAAFRSLLKRIVPVIAYNKIGQLKQIDPQSLISSVAVKSERSSTTRYIATLDFAFSPQAVQAKLRRAGLAFIDTPAPETSLVTIYSPPATAGGTPPKDMRAGVGNELWRTIWSELDLKNSVTPLKLRQRARGLKIATIQSVAGGKAGAISALSKLYGQAQIVLAIAEPDLRANRLNVVVAGQDASGVFSLKRQYRIDTDDFAYTLELAAVIAQGVIEGRWKAIQSASLGNRATAQVTQDIEIWVQFASFAEWRRLQQILQEAPGVEAFQTGDISANGASVKLRFPGGGEELQRVLAAQGLSLTSYNNNWVLR